MPFYALRPLACLAVATMLLVMPCVASQTDSHTFLFHRTQASSSHSEEGAGSGSAVEQVQLFFHLRREPPGLKVTGSWNEDTRDAVQQYVKHLQQLPLGENRWHGPVDGVYSPAFSVFLQGLIREYEAQGIDESGASGVDTFRRAMDTLQSSGVYKPHNAAPSITNGDSGPDDQTDVSSGEAPSGGVVLPFSLWFANGALSGFGDEIYCATFAPRSFATCHEDAKEQLASFDEQHHAIAIAANLVGSAVNVISVMLSLVAIETEWSGLSVLLLSFVMGVVDCVLYAIGDAWTAAQSLSLSAILQEFRSEPGPIIVTSVLSGFVMCWVVAMHRWKYKKPPIRTDMRFEHDGF